MELKELFHLDFVAGAPRYLQIAAKIRELIENGTLPPLTRLPPKREMALWLNVSHDTVEKAITRLCFEHLLESRRRYGVFVSNPVDAKAIPQRLVQEPAFPYLKIGMTKAPRIRPLKNSSVRLDLHTPTPELKLLDKFQRYYSRLHPTFSPSNCVHVKEQLVEHLKQDLPRRGIVAEGSQFCITEGEWNILRDLALVLGGRRKGAMVIPYSLDHYMNRAISAAGIEADVLRSDHYDAFLDRLDHMCRKQQVEAVWLETRVDSLNGTTLSDAQRHRLVDLAGTYSFAIVELDFNHEFSYSAFRPLIADSPENVIYVSCLSKMTHQLYDIKYAIGPANLISSLRSLSPDCSMAAEFRLATAIEMLAEQSTWEVIRQRAEACRDAASRLAKHILDALSPRVGAFLPSAGTRMVLTFPEETNIGQMEHILEAENIYAGLLSQGWMSGDGTFKAPVDYSGIKPSQAAFIARRFIAAFRSSTPRLKRL